MRALVIVFCNQINAAWALELKNFIDSLVIVVLTCPSLLILITSFWIALQPLSTSLQKTLLNILTLELIDPNIVYNNNVSGAAIFIKSLIYFWEKLGKLRETWISFTDFGYSQFFTTLIHYFSIFMPCVKITNPRNQTLSWSNQRFFRLLYNRNF